MDLLKRLGDCLDRYWVTGRRICPYACLSDICATLVSQHWGTKFVGPQSSCARKVNPTGHRIFFVLAHIKTDLWHMPRTVLYDFFVNAIPSKCYYNLARYNCSRDQDTRKRQETDIAIGTERGANVKGWSNSKMDQRQPMGSEDEAGDYSSWSEPVDNVVIERRTRQAQNNRIVPQWNDPFDWIKSNTTFTKLNTGIKM